MPSAVIALIDKIKENVYRACIMLRERERERENKIRQLRLDGKLKQYLMFQHYVETGVKIRGRERINHLKLINGLKEVLVERNNLSRTKVSRCKERKQRS